MPLAGTLHVAGKTVAEIRALATQRLGDNYLVNPQISVTMKDYLSRPIAVLGAVEKGGVFYIRKNFVTVTEALSLAGGLNEKAGTTAVVIEPQLQGPPKRTEISIVDLVLKADPSNNIPIGPHATITVLPAEDFYIVGYVPRPGNFPFHRPLTVTQAVGLAGGVDERGSLEVVEIKRPTAQGMEKIPVDLVAIAAGDKPDVPILPHDTIQVGRTWTKAFLDFIDKIASHFGFGYSL
jgi:polysaccharide export outer membrane protein